MKYHISHEETSSDYFKDLHKVELLTNFDISLTSFLMRSYELKV